MWDGLEVDASRELERRAFFAARILEAAAAPVHVLGLDAVFVGEHAAYPDVGGDLVFGQAYGLALEVGRRLDAAVGADVDARVAEQARHKGRHADVGVLAAGGHQRVAGHRDFRHVKFVELEGAVKSLLGFYRHGGHFTALYRRAAVKERAATIVVATRHTDTQFVHVLPILLNGGYMPDFSNEAGYGGGSTRRVRAQPVITRA